MSLESTFTKLQPSIVAFGSKFTKSSNGAPPIFPALIGTGFVVDARGVVATNRHVAEALMALPSHPATGEHGAFGLVFTEVAPENEGYAMGAHMVELVGIQVLSDFVADDYYYGAKVPDLAFVQLAVTELPAVQLATQDWSWHIGMEIATAGFPLGEDPLVVHGIVGQATPLLRRGIISSLNPFQCPQPHGFTIDVMSQGGASGSPIFRTDNAEVVGILHAGFEGTNITFGVTSFFISEALKSYFEVEDLSLDGIPTFEELKSSKKKRKPEFGPSDWSAV
jgi:S1-C subfamily serine protease